MNRRSRDIGDDAVRIVPLDHENKLRFQAKFGDPWVRREDFPRSKRQLGERVIYESFPTKVHIKQQRPDPL